MIPPLILGFLSFLFLCLTTRTTMSQDISWSKQGCLNKCGDVTIAFPFGIGSNCSANASFEITCSHSTNPPQPFLKAINRRVLNISVQGVVIIDEPVSPMICSASERIEILPLSLESTPLSISALYNSFTVLGCTNSARLLDSQGTEFSGCKAICQDSYTSSTNSNSCSGLNCCEATIPPKLKKFQYTYQSINPSNGGYCGYALPVEKKWLQQDYTKYRGLQMNQSYPYDKEFVSAPLVLEWEHEKSEIIDLHMCKDASDYASSHPLRYHYGSDYVSSTRYCTCGGGEEGNPYVSGGCRDINECSTMNPCAKGMVCVNFDHGYGCEYPKGHSRISKPKIVFVVVVGALLLVFAVFKARYGRIVKEEDGEKVGNELEGIQMSQLEEELIDEENEDRRRLLHSSMSN